MTQPTKRKTNHCIYFPPALLEKCYEYGRVNRSDLGKDMSLSAIVRHALNQMLDADV